MVFCLGRDKIMTEYIKVKSSFFDRILFLFAGLINKNKINNIQDVENVKDVKKEDVVFTKNGMNEDIVDDIPDKIDIPFFELNDTSIESNLDG